MTALDQIYQGARAGDENAFAAWVSLVESPLRRSLRSFARSVDVEGVLQEALLRMWKLAPTLELSGENASLRYATLMAKHIAISEARRLRTMVQIDSGGATSDPALQVGPAPPPDPVLRQIILGCIEKLPDRPRQALLARLQGEADDRASASRLRMKPSTFFQYIVRARRLIRACLEHNGVSLDEVLR
jgi:DNA-directed RNA polymerase specialized sigma24 family protein